MLLWKLFQLCEAEVGSLFGPYRKWIGEASRCGGRQVGLVVVCCVVGDGSCVDGGSAKVVQLETV